VGNWNVDGVDGSHGFVAVSTPEPASWMLLCTGAAIIAGYGWQRGKGWEPGSANFAVLHQWNKSEVYARTVASFASQLVRAP